MQDHSTVLEPNPLNFTHKEARIRRNLAAVSQIDAKMRNDINAARRKLTNSVNSPYLRQIHLQMMGGGQSNNMRVQHTTHTRVRDGVYPHSGQHRSSNTDQRIRQLEQAVRKARAQAEYYRGQWQRLQGQMSELERIKKENQELIFLLNRAQKGVDDGDRATLINELNIARTSIETLRTQIHQLTQENVVYRTKMAESVRVEGGNEELQTLARQLETVQQENTALSSALLDLKRSNENIALNMKAGGLQSDSQEILRLTQQFKQQRQVSSRKYREEIASWEERYAKLESQYTREQKKVANILEEQREKEEVLRKTRIELETFRVQMTEINSNMAKFQKLKRDNEQLMKMASSRTQLSQKASSLEGQKSSLQFEVSSLRADIETLTIKTQRLEEQNKYLRSKNIEAASAIEGRSTLIEKQYQQLNREVLTIRQENTHLKIVINDLRQNIVHLNSQTQTSTNDNSAQIRRLTLQINDLKRDKEFNEDMKNNELALLQKQKQELLKDKSSNQQNVYALESKIRQLERSLRDAEFELESSKGQYQMQSQSQTKSLRRDIEHLKTTITTLQNENSYYKTKPKEVVQTVPSNNNYEEDMQRLESRYSQQLSELKRDKQFTENTHREEVLLLERQKQQLQQERSNDQEKIFNLESQARQMERSIQQFEHKLDLQKSELSMQLQNQVKSSSISIETLKATIEQLQEQNSYYKNKVNEKSAPVVDYAKQEQLSSAIRQLEQECQQYKQQNSAYRSTIQEQQYELTRSESTINQLEQYIQQAQREIERLNTIHLQPQTADNSQELLKMQKDNQELHHMLLTYQHFETVAHQLELEKTGIHNELMQSRVNIDQLKSAVVNLEEQNKQLKLSNEEFTRQTNAFQTATSHNQQYDTLNRQIIQLTKEKEENQHSLNLQIAKLQECMNQLERQYLLYQQRATNVETTIKDIEDLYNKALEEGQKLRKQLIEKESTKVESRKDVETIKQLEAERNQFEKQRKELQKQRNELLRERNLNKSAFSELETNFKKISEERSFFENKLFQAEQYIGQCDAKLSQLEVPPTPQEKPTKIQPTQPTKTQEDSEDLTFIKNKLIEAENYIQFSESEKAKVQEELRKTINEGTMVHKQLQRISQLLEQAQKQKNTLKGQISILEKNHTSTQSNTQEVNKLTLQLNQEKVERVNSQNTLKQQITGLDRKRQELQQQDSASKLKISQMESSNRQLEKSLQKLRIEIEQLKNNAKNSQSSQVSLERLQKEKDQLALKVSMQADLLHNMSNLEKQKYYFQTEFKAAMAKISNLETERTSFEEQLKTQGDVNTKELSQENVFLKRKLAEAEQYLFELENRLNTAEERASDDQKVNELLGKVSTLEITNKKIENRYVQIEEREKAHLSKISSLEEEIRSATNLYSQSQTEVIQLRTKIQKINVELQQSKIKQTESVPEDAKFFKAKLEQAQAFISRLEQEKDKIAKELADFISKAKKHEDDLKRQRILLNQAENANDSLHKIIHQLKENNKELIEEFKEGKIESDEELDGLKEQISELKQRQSTLKAQIARWQQKGKELERSIDSLKNYNQQLRDQSSNTSSTELQGLRRERDELLAKINSNSVASQNYLTLQITYQNLQNEITSNKSRIHSLQVSKQTLETEVNTLKAKISLLEGERENLQKELVLVEADKKNIQNETHQTSIKIKHLESEKLRLERELVIFKEKGETFGSDIQQLTKENAAFKDKLNDAENHVRQLQQTIEHLSHSQAQKSEGSIENDLQFFKSKLIEAQNYIGYLQTEKQGVEQRLTTSQTGVKQLQGQISTLTQQLNEAKEDKARLIAKIQQQQQQISDRGSQSNQVEYIQKQLDTLTVEKKQSELVLRQELVKIKQETQQIKQQVASERQRAEQAQLDKKALQQSLQILRAQQNFSSSTVITNLQTQITTFTQETTTLTTKLNQAEAQIARLERQNSEQRRSTEERVGDLERKEDQYVNRIKKLERDNITLGQELSSVEERLAQMRNSKNQQTAAKDQGEPDQEVSSEDVQFFKKKLLEAQSYIEFLEKQKYKLENQLQTSTAQLHKSQAETTHFSQQLTSLKEQKHSLNSIITDLRKDIKIISDSVGSSNNEQFMRQSQQLSQLRREKEKGDREHQKEIEQMSKTRQELETRYSDAERRLRELQSIVAQSREGGDLQQKSDYFEGKLLQAEGYIVELEKTLHEKEAELENQSSTTILRDKIVELEGKNRETEMRVILLTEKEKNYVEKISNLEERLSQVNQELSEAQSEMDRENKKNEEIIQKLQAEIRKTDKNPQKELQYFKTKLLSAETYITDLLNENKDLKERVQTGGADMSEEVIRLTEETVVNEAVIKQLQNQNAGLTHQIQQLNDSSKTKEDADTLKAEINCLNDLLSHSAVKPTEETETVDFFKGKLYEAQAYIKELEEQNENSKLALIEMTRKLQILDEQIAKLKDKSISDSRQLDQDPSQLLRELLDTRDQLTDLKEENDTLQRKLATVRIQLDSNEETDPANKNDLTFIKNKLYEAESYIVSLEKDVQTLNQESVEREEAYKELQFNNQTLSMALVEAEAKNKQLQQKIEESLSQEKKEQEQSRYKNMLDQQATEMGELLGKFRVKEETNSTLTQQVENYKKQLEKMSTTVKFFENKLLEAERYSTELEQARASQNQQHTTATETLRTTIFRLNQEKKVEEEVKLNLMKIIDQKGSQISQLSGLKDIIEGKDRQIQQLHHQLTEKSQFVEDLLTQVRRVSDENNKLTEQMSQINQGKGQDSEQGETKIEEDDKARIKQLENELDNLVDQLRQLKGQLDNQHIKSEDKDRIIDHLKKQLEESNSNAETMAHKVSHLVKVEQELAELKATISEREQVDRQLQQLQKEEAAKNDVSQSSSKKGQQPSSPSKSRHLEHSLQEANKELQNEMREEIQNESRELVKEIDYLKSILEGSEEENKQLRNEQAAQLKVIEQLSENNHLLNEQIVHFREMEEEIGKQVVQAEAENKKMQQEMEQMQAIIKRQEQSILSGSRSINQGSSVAEGTDKEAPKATVQDMNDALVQITKQELEHVRNNQVLMKNLTTDLVEKDNRIKELQNMLTQQALTDFPQARSPAKNEPEAELTSFQLQQELYQQREHLVMAECEIEMLKKQIKKVTDQRDTLMDKLAEYEQKVTNYEGKIGEYELEMSKHKLLRMQSGISEKQAEEKGAQTERDQKLNNSIRKLISITSNEQNGDPSQILQELEDFPYLNELITSILYKLQLASAMELEKGLKIENQKKSIEQLENRNEELQTENKRFKTTVQLLKQELTVLRETNQRIQSELLKKFQEKRSSSEPSNLSESQQVPEDERIQSMLKESDDRYNELLKEVVEYEVNNNQLSEQLAAITTAHQQLKDKLKEYEHHLANISNTEQLTLSQQNFELRKKLEDSQKIKNKDIDNSSQGTQSLLRLEFLNVCLDRIDEIERQVQAVEGDIQHVATRERQMMSTSELKVGDDSQLVDRLQELEERLLRNATNIKQHQQKSDGELYGLLKELLQDEQVSENSKKRIEDYLGQLEQQIVREHEQHQAEVQILRAQIASNDKEHQEYYTDRSKDDLLREINNLNNAVEIYHQETMRRKKEYRQSLETLLELISQLHQTRPSDETGEMVHFIQRAFDKQQEEDLELEGDDFIIAGGSGHMQVLEGRGQGSGLRRLRQDVGELEQGTQQGVTRAEADRRPFLNFLLSAQDIDREDLRLLRKKVAQLRGRQIDENIQLLRNNERRLEEVMQLANKDSSPQQIQNIMVTLANNYSHDQISQIFGSEDADQLINKLNEALCLEDSFYKGQNSSTMMNEIEERKKKYYETPTKLSEEVFKHLILLLSAKKDEEFYEQIDSLFKNMYDIEEGFESALRKKDEVYRSHNERMNQIFNKSSSDNSEDYLGEFERENMAAEVEARVQSQRKGKKEDSQEEDRQE